MLRLLATPKEERPALFARADAVRKAVMGDGVFLRGIVEFSNICANHCRYCGIRAPNAKVARYRMNDDEILILARQMEAWKQTTIVLQSGEVATLQENRRIGDLVRRIKKETNLAVTLSAGNRDRDVYLYWRECGMDRYLLRFETSDPALFSRVHPDCTLEERLDCLKFLREVGAQVGSGFMIGLPGETRETLAQNILLCRDLGLDMIGIGPFIPHPDTPMGSAKNVYSDDPAMYLVALAALRLANPMAHIPATTSFDAVFPGGAGRDLCLQCGANVFMPNATPCAYKEKYLLYPGKPSVDDPPETNADDIIRRIESLGRHVESGPGHSIRKRT